MIKNSSTVRILLCGTAIISTLNASDFSREHVEDGLERSYPRVATGVDQRVETVNPPLEEIYRQAIEGRKHAFTELVSLS
jgi:hypothetical protein